MSSPLEQKFKYLFSDIKDISSLDNKKIDILLYLYNQLKQEVILE